LYYFEHYDVGDTKELGFEKSSGEVDM